MSDLRKAAERLLHGNRPAIQSDDFSEVIRNCQQHNTDCDEVAKAYLAQADALEEAVRLLEWCRATCSPARVEEIDAFLAKHRNKP